MPGPTAARTLSSSDGRRPPGGMSARILAREPDDAVVAEVSADHPLGKTGLIRLLDDEPVALEVCVEAPEERIERKLLGRAVVARVLGADRARPVLSTFHTPSPPIPRRCLRTSGRAAASRAGSRSGAPTAVRGGRHVSVPHPSSRVSTSTSFVAMREDHVRVRAHEDAVGSGFAEQRVEA